MSSYRTRPIISLTEIVKAQRALAKLIPLTPLTRSPNFSELVGKEIFFKWDNKLKTGSFKERGAAYFLSTLTKNERRKGVCAASAGNHALALSYHAARLRIPCTIVMPEHAPLIKVQSTEQLGATVILHGLTFAECREQALGIAKDRKLLFVSPFDDPRIIAGQGTVALEIVKQLSALDSIVVPIGGGGLISGIALALRARKPKVFILGVRSNWAMRHKVPKSPVAIAPTSIADGIAVKQIGEITGPIIDELVDEIVTVDENEIAEAIVTMLEEERTVIEGAAGAGLAAILAGQLPKRCKRVVSHICGSNIDLSLVGRLIERSMEKRGRLLRLLISVPDRPGSLNTLTTHIAKLRANVLQVLHDRSSSKIPSNVNISLLLEVKDTAHKRTLLRHLRSVGLAVTEIDAIG